jgi:hypothetical protein
MAWHGRLSRVSQDPYESTDCLPITGTVQFAGWGYAANGAHDRQIAWRSRPGRRSDSTRAAVHSATDLASDPDGLAPCRRN